MPTRSLPEELKENSFKFSPQLNTFHRPLQYDGVFCSIAEGFLTMWFDFFFSFFLNRGWFLLSMCNLFFLSPFYPHATEEKYRKHTNNNRASRRERGLEWKEENFLIPLSIFQTALIIVFLHCMRSIYIFLSPENLTIRIQYWKERDF